MSRRLIGISRASVVIALLGCLVAAQSKTYERSLRESAANIRKVLQGMQPAMAGRLPILDGFVVSGDRPLTQYQRGYYQASVQMGSGAAGETVVRVTVKVTAWYSDSDPSRSGYQLLTSNGRIEADILDQLSEKVAALKPPRSEKLEAASDTKVDPSLISAPKPQTPSFPHPLSPSSQSIAPTESAASDAASPTVASMQASQLEAELQQLQEVLKNQAHPKNLVAVIKSGTPVVPNPSLNAKPLFLASAHDEFEMLNFTQDWVHVQISGLSRGWIWRNALEMPGDVPDTQSESAHGSVFDLFRVVREETALFPGDWEPLRGKLVKLISVQKADDSKDAGPQIKLEFARSLLEKNYAEMVAQKSVNLAGIVVIFDSADGGMVAVPQSVLAKWKAGELPDAALWHASFFDPPETFVTSTSSTR